MTGLVAFGRFELRRLLRSWKFLSVTVGFPVIFYMLFLGNHSSTRVVDGTVDWPLYLMVSMCSFGALVTGLNAGGTRLSGERASGWARQLRATPLPARAHVSVKVLVSMLVVLPVLVLVELVGWAGGGVRLDLGTWVELTVLLWVTALPFVVLGVFVGFMASPETAYPVVTVLMFILGYFGGLFTPVSSMPSGLQAVAKVFPTYQHTSLGLTYLVGRGLWVGHALVLAAYVVALGALSIWKHRVDESRGVA